jgi:hypothetical protein
MSSQQFSTADINVEYREKSGKYTACAVLSGNLEDTFSLRVVDGGLKYLWGKDGDKFNPDKKKLSCELSKRQVTNFTYQMERLKNKVLDVAPEVYGKLNYHDPIKLLSGGECMLNFKINENTRYFGDNGVGDIITGQDKMVFDSICNGCILSITSKLSWNPWIFMIGDLPSWGFSLTATEVVVCPRQAEAGMEKISIIEKIRKASEEKKQVGNKKAKKLF